MGQHHEEGVHRDQGGSGGAWSCKVDLWKLGAPLGKLTLSFNVTPSAGDVAKAPAGTRTVKFAVPPPKPRNVRITDAPDPNKAAFRMTWGIGAGPVSNFLIYGIPMSLSCDYKWRASGPARLVATVAASSRSWIAPPRVTNNADGWRFTIAASNTAGRSASVVAKVDLWWGPFSSEDIVTALGTSGCQPE